MGDLKRPAGVSGHELLDQLGLDGHSYQVLLGTIVQVAFNSSSFCIRGRHEACPGGLQLISLAPQLVERFFERHVEPSLVDGHANLTRDLCQRLVRLDRQSFGLARAIYDDETKQLAGLADRCDPPVPVRLAV